MYKFIYNTLAFLIPGLISTGQVYEYKLFPDTGKENEHFGHSVAISNDYAVVGATGTEKVYVFKRSGANWYQSDTLKGESNPFGSTSDPVFGYSVSISEDYLIVGAPFQVVPPVINCIGSAYIFKRNNERWYFHAKLTPPEPHPFGLYGWTVAISNSYAVVGETGRNVAFIYKLKEDTCILDTALSDGWRFGETVAVSGNNLAIGTPGGYILDTDEQGSIQVFSQNGFKWMPHPQFQASDGNKIDGFGNTVAISGDIVLAGDDKAKNSYDIITGAAYFFNHQDTIWVEAEKITARDGSYDDLFGYDVSISGDYAVISAPQDQDNGYHSGSAYLFKYNGENWTEEHKLLASDGSIGDNFGYSVAICGDYTIVGAVYNDDPVEGSGSAYIYSPYPPDIEGQKKIYPDDFSLSQNYPNPFRTTTNIKYALTEGGIVRLAVYDMFGRNIKILLNKYQIPGVYSVEFEADQYKEGIYQYILEVNGQRIGSKKMIIIK